MSSVFWFTKAAGSGKPAGKKVKKSFFSRFGFRLALYIIGSAEPDQEDVSRTAKKIAK
jgi:hypothetical protein